MHDPINSYAYSLSMSLVLPCARARPASSRAYSADIVLGIKVLVQQASQEPPAGCHFAHLRAARNSTCSALLLFCHQAEYPNHSFAYITRTDGRPHTNRKPARTSQTSEPPEYGPEAHASSSALLFRPVRHSRPRISATSATSATRLHRPSFTCLVWGETPPLLSGSASLEGG
jgi:hypothetical protein